MSRTVLRSPVIAQRDPAGHIGVQATEAVDHAVVDRLQGGEPITNLATCAHASAVEWSTTANTHIQPSTRVQAMMASVPQRT